MDCDPSSPSSSDDDVLERRVCLDLTKRIRRIGGGRGPIKSAGTVRYPISSL